MSPAPSVFAIVNNRPVVCTCPKRDCPRHGNCEPCRNYHLHAKRPRPPYCEREHNWFRKIFGKQSTASK